MIPPDGLHTNADYPETQPVLSPKAPAGPLDLPAESMANMDWVYWVTELRPMLIAAGNLVETEEHRKEYRAMMKAQKNKPQSNAELTKIVAAVKASPLSAAVRTPAGDYVPPEPFVSSKAAAFAKWAQENPKELAEMQKKVDALPDYVPPVDFKARASGERDEPEPDGVPF
jgi:hypothetical protein